MLDARIDEKHPGRTQTLRDHCRAVAGHCGEAMNPARLYSLGYLAGLLHDFGKARARFQTYLHENDPAKKKALHGTINHSAAGAQWLTERYGRRNDIGSAFALELLCLAITGHHGGLSDCLTPMGEDALTNRVFPWRSDIEFAECETNFFGANIADTVEIDRLFDAACIEATALANRAFSEAKKLINLKMETAVQHLSLKNKEMFAHGQLGLTARLLLSALVDADRYDALFFVQNGHLEEPPKTDNTFWCVLSDRLENKLADFDQTKPLTESRRVISEACLLAGMEPGGIRRLYAPTGGGKTLAALRYALTHAKHEKKKRIFYIIPYTTIIDQTAKVLRETIGNESFIVEHHSGVLWEESGEGDDLNPRELYTERWNAPIILTTMVQFLDTCYSARLGCTRRMQGLEDAVIIFDEVQAVPTKCIDLFNAACTFLCRHCNMTALLCTATQPDLYRANFPLRYENDVIADSSDLNCAFRRTHITDLRERGEMTAEQLAEFCLDKMETNRSLLVVLNTRCAVRKLYEILCNTAAPDIHIIHLSTLMCGAHRKDRVAEIEKLLNGERVICVSTQLIEAGVDLSFSCAVRSLAGLENLAQTAGRCNRHAIDKTLHEVYLIRCAEENLKSLWEIRMGQKACNLTLAAIQDMGLDPLEPKAIEIYYKMRYSELTTQTWMSYPLDGRDADGLGGDDSLLDLLCVNTPGRRAAKHNQPLHIPRILEQAFDTVGGIFKPIENPAISVLVPYGEGKEIIAKLEAETDPKAVMALLRRAQQYTVNVFHYDEVKLELSGALRALPCGTIVLDERFYDVVSGVSYKGRHMELLLV